MQDLYALIADLPLWAKTALADLFDPTTLAFKASMVKPLDPGEVHVNCSRRRVVSIRMYDREWNAAELVTAEIGSAMVNFAVLYSADGEGDSAGTMLFVVDEGCTAYQIAQDHDADMYARWWHTMVTQ